MAGLTLPNREYPHLECPFLYNIMKISEYNCTGSQHISFYGSLAMGRDLTFGCGDTVAEAKFECKRSSPDRTFYDLLGRKIDLNDGCKTLAGLKEGMSNLEEQIAEAEASIETRIAAKRADIPAMIMELRTCECPRRIEKLEALLETAELYSEQSALKDREKDMEEIPAMRLGICALMYLYIKLTTSGCTYIAWIYQ